MTERYDRRSFLAAGLALPLAGLGSQLKLEAAGQSTTGNRNETQLELKYRTLGKTGLKITEVGFGCGTTTYPGVIARAADLGINYFDTARMYQNGNNERMVGAALKSKRKDVVICSKTMLAKKELALAHLETSLKELGADYIDIWLLQAADAPEKISDEWLDLQAQAKKDGKIRFSGVSTHNVSKVLPAVLQHAKELDVFLLGYNYSMPQGVEEALEAVAKAGLGIVAMKVMAGNLGPRRPPEKVAETPKKPGASLAALKWVLRNKNIHVAIPGTDGIEQLEENIRAMGSSFTEADSQLLAAQLEHISPLYCRMCGACDGKCPQGVPVASVLRYLAYAEGYHQYSMARSNYLDLPQAVRNVRCQDCSSCAIACPNGVRVSERLQIAQELLA